MGNCCDRILATPTDGHIGPATFKRATKRTCTDVLFLLLYVVFCAGTVAIAVYSYHEGDNRRLIKGYDDYGNICGVKDNEKIPGAKFSGMDMSDKPYVYYQFFGDVVLGNSIATSYKRPYISICVKECPSAQSEHNASASVMEAYENGNSYCRYDVKLENEWQYYQAVDNYQCPILLYQGHPILNRCFPDLKYNLELIKGIFEQISYVELVTSDLINSHVQIIGMCIFSIFVAFLMTMVIRWLAAILIYVATILCFVGSVAIIGAVWYVYYREYKALDAIPSEEQLESMKDQLDYILYFSIAITIIFCIVILVLIAMFPRLKVVVRLFVEASKVVAGIPLILLTPLTTFLVLILFLFYWVVVMALIVSNEKAVRMPFDTVWYEAQDAYVRYFWWYMIVAAVWCSEFIMACHQFIISFAVSKWYFAEDRSQLSRVLGKGIVCLIKNHLGSICLGSFIITLVKVPRMILIYIQKKLKGSENAVAQTILKMMTCCLWCLEKCLKFLNKNAYIVVAITGKGFCPSAQQAVVILVSNALRVVALNTVGTFVVVICKLGVAAITAAIGLLWFQHGSGSFFCQTNEWYKIFCAGEDLNYYFIPAIIASVFSYFVASCFFGVYELVLATLLICVSEDSREQDVVDAPMECPTLKADRELLQCLNQSGQEYDTIKTLRKKKRPAIDMPDLSQPNAPNDEKVAETAA